LTEDQKFWRDNGYIIFRNGIDPDVVDRYGRSSGYGAGKSRMAQ
jgi:hypothetical protein